MTYKHSMIQVLAVQDQVMVAILRNDCIVGLNCTDMNLKQWDIIDELDYMEVGAVKKIDGISLYMGKRNFMPANIHQRGLDAIDEAKIAHELGSWLDKLNIKKTDEPQPLIIRLMELLPLLMPLKLLVSFHPETSSLTF